MARKVYQKPQLTEHDLRETPKLFKLVQVVCRVDCHLRGDVLRLAYYAAALARGMVRVDGNVSPENAERPVASLDTIDHSADIIDDREGRLCSINVCCKRILHLIAARDFTCAERFLTELLVDLGVEQGEKVLDSPCAGVVGVSQ